MASLNKLLPDPVTKRKENFPFNSIQITKWDCSSEKENMSTNDTTLICIKTHSDKKSYLAYSSWKECTISLIKGDKRPVRN